jgi:hypothetical protein
VRLLTSCISPVLCAAALLGFVVSGPAVADDTSTADNVSASRGVKPGFVYDGAGFANLGGARPGSTYTSNLNLQLNIDAVALYGWPDTIGYLDGLWLQGGLPSSFIGDAQASATSPRPTPSSATRPGCRRTS